MIAIPTAIAEQFDQLLIGKSLPHTVRFSYRKWLRFYCTSSQPLLDKSQHKVNVSGFDDASGMTLRVELWPIQQKRILLRHKPEPGGSLCSIVC